MAEYLGTNGRFQHQILAQVIQHETGPNITYVWSNKAWVESGQYLTQLAIRWTERSPIVAVAKTWTGFTTSPP